MKKKTRSLLKKYQFGTPMGSSFGGFNSPTLETWSPSPNSPTQPPSVGEYNFGGTQSSIPGTSDFSTPNDAPKGFDSSIAGGIISGIGTGVTAGLNAATANTKANTRSEIDPTSVYAYDPSKSIWAKQQQKASDTAVAMDTTGDIMSSIPILNMFAPIFKASASATRAGQAELTKRDVEGHNEIYKKRMNVGGKDGNFTTQGQFTTREAQEDPGIPMAKMGGGLYANIHAKRARIKAGSGEKMRSPGDKGAPSAANFERAARTSNKQMGGSVPAYGASGMVEYGKGGYLSQYMRGGMVVSEGVPEKYANVEVEGGEVIEKAEGPDIYVKGPSHKNGGVPMMLQEGGPAQGGDYVWSDHLTYKGKTMAELYAMAVQNGASEQEIDQLRMLQEQLAGRAGDPQDAKELQEMPMAKKGGMLKKYQLAGAVGTNSRIFPDGTEMPVLSDSEYNRIMKEKQMKDLEALQNSAEYNEGMANLSWAPGSAANVALGKYGKLPSKEEVEREREMKRAADVQYYREQGLNSEGQPYSEEDLKSANAGEVGSGNLLSKTGTQIYGKRSAGDKALELLPYGTAGAGMIAQLAATLAAKNPYKGIKTPSAALVSTPEKQFFERINSRAEEAQNARGASLSKQLLQQAGFGPGEMAAVQKVELDRQAADAQATQRAREFNVSQDRAEKQLNTEMKLRSEMANQSALNERSMQEYQRMLSERGFETERGMNTGDIVAGSLSDIGKFASDRTFAKAIEGDSGVGQRAWNYDPVQARAEIMSETPQKDGESGSEYQSRINRLERENSKRYEEEYMRKVAERRRRYTQMRGTDGEQS